MTPEGNEGATEVRAPALFWLLTPEPSMEVLELAPIPMTTGTILMMVAPSMLVFGLLAFGLGVKHGEYRAA